MNLCGKGVESLNWRWIRLKLSKTGGRLPTTSVGCLLLSPLASVSTTLSWCYLDVKCLTYGIVFHYFVARPRFLIQKNASTIVKHILVIHAAIYSCQKFVKRKETK